MSEAVNVYVDSVAFVIGVELPRYHCKVYVAPVISGAVSLYPGIVLPDGALPGDDKLFAVTRTVFEYTGPPM
jgi:hypothetical protein